MYQVRQLATSARLPVARRAGLLRFSRPGHLVARPPPALAVRCLASKAGGDGDKSWREIGQEVATVAKDFARKVGSTISDAVSAVIPSKEDKEIRRREQEARERQELYREPSMGGGLVGNLLGKALGKVVQSALGAVGEQMRQAQAQMADVLNRAQAIIEGSAQVQERLGGSARCLPPVSQSSMSQSFNGRTRKVVTLILPVVGAGGRQAQAQVQWVEGEERDEKLEVSVRFPGGEVVRLDGPGGATRTIDVEWHDVN